uniref:Kunitz-type protease inhibitor n=1 Tax=Apios americana TaxID=185702 RepID=A0A5H2ZWI8_9FABA|nr:Kunitz-type protease inhibitor [Apios americana]
MKSTMLFALFLLSAFTSYLSSANANPVLDMDGDLVQNGGAYYILPVIRGKGGGIERAVTGKETCPLTVVQSRSEVSKGLPVRISSPYLILNINEGLVLNLGFTSSPRCAPTPWWTIVESKQEGLAVKLTGYEDTVPGWFKIEKASHGNSDINDYKLVFCEHDTSKCGDIGIYIDRKGNRRLVVTEHDPLVVQFQKATSSTA